MFAKAFDELPIACLVNEKILVVHGGIGEGKAESVQSTCSLQGKRTSRQYSCVYPLTPSVIFESVRDGCAG